MNLAITARGYKAPDRLKNYVLEKMKRLDRFSDIIMDGEVVFSYENIDQIAEFKIKLKQRVIRVKEKSEDIFKSVDLGIDNLERQIVKTKDKLKEFDNAKIVENLVNE